LIGSTIEAQNTFHSEITTYINGGVFSRLDLYFSVFVPRVIVSRHAEAIIQKYKRFLNEMSTGTMSELHVRIDQYEGQNRHVQRMMNFLSEHLRDDLIGAYVHGSLGTYEEIAYSDFDALAILKDEVFESSERLAGAARKLNRARKIMLDFDPLEHHGWFALTEADLRYYCNSYFPAELYSHAKSLFDDKGLELTISLRESDYETYETFEKMADSISRKIKNRRYPENMYQLKSLLSQFMLLPALYVQAKHGRGIYKKESFAVARSDFDPAHWAIMDKVSEIRGDWNYEISLMKKWLICHPHVLSRYFAKKFAPAIPQKIGRALTGEFYARIEGLALLMKEMLT